MPRPTCETANTAVSYEPTERCQFLFSHHLHFQNQVLLRQGVLGTPNLHVRYSWGWGLELEAEWSILGEEASPKASPAGEGAFGLRMARKQPALLIRVPQGIIAVLGSYQQSRWLWIRNFLLHFWPTPCFLTCILICSDIRSKTTACSLYLCGSS